ncbi:MAG: flagellar hook protein FlgE [Phycisphaerales bacterium]
MASTTALFTGLSGLTANARNLDVIGNNIANANTTAFKSNRLLFSSTFSRTFSIGSVPNENSGGTNPGQIGLGVNVAGTQRDFSGGALATTGDSRDLAIEGNGFFIVSRGGGNYYTRAGAFRQNSENNLVNISGDRVRGYAVDDQFNIVEGQLVDLSIPVGQLTLAEATRNVRFTGNLNADGPLPTRGSQIDLSALSLVSGPIGGPGGDVLALSSLLTDIDNSSSPGNPLFTAGQRLSVTGVEKGNRTLPTSEFQITPTSTVQEWADFLVAALGINPSTGANPDGNTPGITLDPATGVISIFGNAGAVNDLDIEATDIRLLNADGSFAGAPFTPDPKAQADGESVRTTFITYDSLGTAVPVDISVVLDSRGDAGTSWRYFVESGDDSDVALQVATGVIDFDMFGRLTSAGPVNITVDRAGSGAISPLSIDLAFDSDSGSVTALSDTNSTLAAVFQDGSPIGTLATFGVGVNGIITGAFTNGLTRTLGQVALATFSNPEGLVDIGDNLFTAGPNSGTPVVTTPTSLGAGRVVSGALEQSNVDISQEFIQLILTSTGYSAASRVITTTDQLMQQLLVIGR